MRNLVGLVALATLLEGCAITMPFNNRLDFGQVTEARSLAAQKAGPISIRWIPSSFPDRIDVQGASGFVGGLSRTRIPTGVALSNRITEALDAAVGVSPSSPKVLTITVEKAESKFQYSAGIFNVSQAMDVGSCVLEARFVLGDSQWEDTFSSSQRDPSVGGKTKTGVLERAWDDIAIQVARSVVAHTRGVGAS